MIFFNDDISEAYRVLNLSLDADEEAIKKAYRQAAVRYHPDKNDGNKTCEEQFKRVSLAYETLVKYKEQVSAQARSPFISDSFFFQKDIRLGITITMADAYRGCEHRVAYHRSVFSDGVAVQGLVYADIKIPPKIRSGHIIRVADKGNVKDGKSGDLHVVIQFPFREENVSLSPNGALQTVVSANWADVLMDKPFRFDLFKGGPSIVLPLNSENQDGYVYEVPKSGFVGMAPLFVQVFYAIPSKIKKEDRKALADILKKYE